MIFSKIQMQLLQDPYDLYRCYKALKLHFTNEHYNFIEYHNSRTSLSAFNARADKKMFVALAYKLPKEITIPFFVSQLVENSRTTPSSILEQPLHAQKIYTKWKERTVDIQKLYYSDLVTMAVKSNGSWIRLLEQKQFDYPLLFKLVASKLISPESYALLDTLVHITSKKYQHLSDDNMFYAMNLKYNKYRLFINFSNEQVYTMTPKDLSLLLTKRQE